MASRDIRLRKPGRAPHLDVVLAYREGDSAPWVTWLHNKQVDGYGNGHYFRQQDDAVKDYLDRV